MAHWNLEPIEREDAHGALTGSFRMVACIEGARGGVDCCAHDHASADDALLCAEARKTADRITGDIPTITPSADDLADVAETAHAKHGGDWTKTARAVARTLGHSLAALSLLALGVATEPACSAARETPVDLSSTLPPRATCTAHAWRCNDRVPEVCGVSRDGVTRWYPTTQPASVDGRPAQCAVCVVDRTAHCADARLVDAGHDASDVTGVPVDGGASDAGTQ